MTWNRSAFVVGVVSALLATSPAQAPRGMGGMGGMMGTRHDSAMAAKHAAMHGAAQGMDHTAMQKCCTGVSQAAFSTISDIVRALKADTSTDWSKVNLEALRQHLIDMDNVVMRSTVKQTNVPGGVTLDVTGSGEVTAAIRRMMTMHAMALTEEGSYVAKASEIPGGARFVVTAKDTTNAKAVAMVRGLGFAGLITEGDHHAMHHMMVARGAGMGMHHHKP